MARVKFRAAHPCDHVVPRLPVRQWVLSVPKRLRYFMQRLLRLLRLLRDCARPAFALDRLRKAGRELILRCAKQHSEPGSDHRDRRDQRNAKRGVRSDALHLTPLKLIDRLAALVPPPPPPPPPRAHRHRYYGVLAPNSPLRAASMALAAARGGHRPAHGAARTEQSGSPANWPSTGKRLRQPRLLAAKGVHRK